MSDTRDFFISFTDADKAVATAINDLLKAADFKTWFYPDDLPLGGNIADWMEKALDACIQMIAVCSDAYFDPEKGFSRIERHSMFWADPNNRAPRLLLVKVEECTFPAMVASNQFIDLVGLQAPEAAEKLVAVLQGEQARLARIAAEKLAQDRRPPEVFNVPGGPSALFTGRETEMAQLQERLKSNTATAITAVSGAGGIGKSTLAREYAHRHGLASRYGGVWWIAAESESGILTAYEALADHPGTDIEKGEDQVKTSEAARDWLARQPAVKPWLVIFDNAPDDVSVAEWLPQGTAKVLITSRFEDFDPTVAERMPLDYWDENTTVAFLIARAGRGTEAEAGALAERLGGLPLAAEQAGAYLAARPAMGFAEYAAKLVERLKDKPKRLPSAYPDSVWTTTAAALDAVLERDEGEAALGILTLCAFLSPDGVDLALLQAAARSKDILPDPPRGALASDQIHEALRALTGFALLRVAEDPEWGPVLILHRLLAEVARARLEEAGVATWSGTAVRMTRAVMPTETADGRGHPITDTSVWGLFSRLAPQARALRVLNPGSGPIGEALSFLLNQVALYLSARGDLDGAAGLLKSCVNLTESAYGSQSKQLASALGNLANRLSEREESWDDAEAAYDRALKIKEAILKPDDASIATTLSNWGGLDLERKDFAGAAERIGRAAEIDKAAHGETSTQYATRLNNLGAVYGAWAQSTGDTELRRKESDVTERAARITRVLRGPRHPEMVSRFNNLAHIFFVADDTARAAEEMAQAVAVYLSLDLQAHPQCQICINNLLHLWTQSNQTDKAARLAAGDPSDLIPIVVEIEAEHRDWVADDPANREFGPPSPVTGARE